jgi:hypothetical protein
VLLSSGFWLAAIVLVLPHQQMRWVLMLLTLALWLSHRFSTLYMAYTIPQYRQVVSNQKTRFIVVPIIICGAVCGFLYAPQSIMPLSLTKRFILLACLDFFLSLYHFAMQHYGILALQPSKTTRAEVFAPDTPCGFTLRYPARPVQAALRRAAGPSGGLPGGLPQRAGGAAIGGGRRRGAGEGAAGGVAPKGRLFFLSVPWVRWAWLLNKATKTLKAALKGFSYVPVLLFWVRRSIDAA